MHPIQNILLPIDYSSCTRPALLQALAFAGRCGAVLHLLHVTLTERVGSAQNPAENTKTRTHERLQRVLEDIDPGDTRIVKSQVQGAQTSAAIVAYTKSHGIDLIVMGTHARTGFQRWLLGSVAEEVVHLVRCPVLTLKEKASGSPFTEFKKILVPLDFSLASRAALRYAVMFAELFEAVIHPLHVIQAPNYQDIYGTTFFSLEDFRREAETRAFEIMGGLLADEGAAARAETHVIKGHPAMEIVRFAEEATFDLVLMAHFGLSRLPDRIFGSVTEYVVRTAPCPVMTVDLGNEWHNPTAKRVRTKASGV